MRSISVLIFLATLAAAPAPVTVSMKNMRFAPQNVSIVRGSTVVWKNDDQVPHTVTAADRSWGSPVIEPGRTFRKKFTATGKVDIICIPHPNMKSTVVVKQEQNNAAVVQAVTGVRALGPSTSVIHMAVFIANLVVVLGSVLSASITLLGAKNALAALRRARHASRDSANAVNSAV